MKQLSNYIPIIGLEVHVELSTKSKMFCGCSAKHFLEKPNTHTCPVCLGLPGALPVPNKKAIEWCLLIGLALNCQIAKESKFDRKNYFYPDLPKGYQISQYDMPFCRNGHLKLKVKSLKLKVKKIRINRVHMEEDTGKLIHTIVNGEKVTLIDFNRSGVPLVEIVSEPDINSAEEAVAYLKKIQQIIRYLEVSDCDMEKGSMRCEANVSLALQNQKPKTKNQKHKFKIKKLPNYKVEVKNINSFRFVAKAINYEIQRQRKILASGKTPIQETRGFDEKTGKTYTQRGKEEAQDYRYFPEPDIPPFTKLKAKSLKLKAELPELPESKIERFMKEYKISEYNAEILATNRATADYFEEAVKISQKSKARLPAPPATTSQMLAGGGQVKSQKFTRKVANIIVNKKIDTEKYLPAELVRMLIKKARGPKIDENQIKRIVEQVLKDNPKAVSDYKKGKKQVIGFLIGKVMKETKAEVKPQIVQGILVEKLKSSSLSYC